MQINITIPDQSVKRGIRIAHVAACIGGVVLLWWVNMVVTTGPWLYPLGPWVALILSLLLVTVHKTFARHWVIQSFVIVLFMLLENIYQILMNENVLSWSNPIFRDVVFGVGIQASLSLALCLLGCWLVLRRKKARA